MVTGSVTFFVLDKQEPPEPKAALPPMATGGRLQKGVSPQKTPVLKCLFTVETNLFTACCKNFIATVLTAFMTRLFKC